MAAESSENVEKMESEESEDEEYSYIRTRRGVIQVNKSTNNKKPDRLNGEYSYQNTIKLRVMGQPCIDCKMECDLRLVERFRQDNYLNFWGKIKDWDERRLLVRRLVQVLRVPHPKNNTRKKFLRKYYLEVEDGLTLVCKTMFFNTLAISVKFIETTLQKYPDNILDESKIKLVNSPSVIPKSLDLNVSKEVLDNTLHNSINNETEEELPIEAQLLDIKNKEELKPSCSCPEGCGRKFAHETRLKIYEHFWLKLKSWEERKLFVLNTIEKDRYTSIRTFVLPMKNGGHITVCQEMYLNTLSLNEKAIEFALSPSESNKSPRKRQTSEYSEKEEHPHHQELSIQEINHLTTTISAKINNSKDTTKDFYPAPFKRVKLECIPLKPPCSCELRCRDKLTEDIRQQIHREFWNLPAKVDQKHFILSTIHTQTNRNKVTKEKTHEIKYFMLPFHYDNVVVCKEMYLHTLTISEDFITSTIKNVNHDGSIIEDEELHHINEDHSSNPNSRNDGNPEKKGFKRRTGKDLNKNGSEDRDFINCADLLESQIKEDVLHSEKSEVKKLKKTRTSKKMGTPCPSSCRHQCSVKFTEEQRQELHDKFWESMNWQERKQFVMQTVKEFPIKNRSIPGRLTKRNFSRIYTLPMNENKITVCQKMYFNTLSICSKFVSTVHIWASQVKW